MLSCPASREGADALGHDAIHTLDLPDRNATKDDQISLVADRGDRIVITKDNDFRDSHLLRGTPRQLLRVTTGNIRNADPVVLFERHLDAIQEAFESVDHIELNADELVVYGRRGLERSEQGRTATRLQPIEPASPQMSSGSIKTLLAST